MNDAVVPFVVVESAGGPYDDEAFNAGFHLGMLNMGLFVDNLPKKFAVPMLRTMTHQADLIAMKHGWSSKVMEEIDEQWVLLYFEKSKTSLFLT